MKLIYHDGRFFAPARIVSMELRYGKWYIVGDGGSFTITLDSEGDAKTVEAVVKCLSIVNKENIQIHHNEQ
ncbi:MAG: hypothetical protein E7108_01760 [Bacteroidales bacterium]|nr:hypothetical protein [Bacteroidales bacterium]